MQDASPDAFPPWETDVWLARAKLAQDHLPLLLGGNLLGAVGLVAALWSPGAGMFLPIWLTALCLFCLERFFAGRRSRQKIIAAEQPGAPPFDYRSWFFAAAVRAGLSGVLWGSMLLGSIAVDTFPNDPHSLQILVVVYVGVVSGSVVPHSTWLPAYLAFALPTVLTFALRMFATADPIYSVIGVLAFPFLALNIYFGRNLQRTLAESIRLRCEKAALVDELLRGRVEAEQAREMAQRANASKTRFLAAASHDLRQPAQALALFVDALQEEELTPRVRELTNYILQSEQALRGLINALMDYSMVESAALRPEIRSFPADPLLRRLCGELAPLALEHGVTLRWVPTRLWLASDPTLLERILRNLLSNAVKYADGGAVLLGCRRVGGNAVRIEIHDGGPGIAPELHEQIFHEFFQVGNPQRDRRNGLGLGLAIVRGVATLLQHPIGLRSKVGYGSVFHVLVPRVPPATDELGLHAAERADDLAGCLVVVVEDDESIRRAMRELLLQWRCHVVLAATAEEAQAELDGEPPDAIIADYRLAEGRFGIDAIAFLQAHVGEQVPAVLMTGDLAPEVVQRARAEGFQVLVKPISARNLYTALVRLVHGA